VYRRERCRFDAGHRIHAFQQALVKRAISLPRVSIQRGIDIERDQVVCSDSGIKRTQVPQRADEQPCADEQQKRQHDLCHHQDLTEIHLRPAAHDCPCLFLQRVGHIGSRRLQRRHKSEQETGEQGHADVECQDSQIGSA